uniref:glucuronosyltransferase n=1 Tax=Meloidogyne floridensis TaxID=298350 RepID=A0A915NLX9_9BILA
MAGYYLSFEVYDSLTLIMRKHFGSNYPDIRQIIKDSPLILVNADEFVDFPRPLFSNIIYIGGIGMNEKIEESLDKLDDQLNFEMKKGKKDHPRLKLFITHCGYNSLLEAGTAGVPVLVIPFFFDQFRNARVAERNGWGLYFDKRLLLKSDEEFKIALQKILENERFKLNAERTQKLIMTKPFSGEQRLIESFNFLEQNGGDLKELLPESRNLSTTELYNLDIIFFVVLSLLLLLLTLIIAYQIYVINIE